MKSYLDLIQTFVKGYDYNAASKIAKKIGHKKEDYYKLLKVVKSNINFDFENSYMGIKELKDKLKKYDYLEKNTKNLIYLKPREVFSELIWSLIFQIKAEEYIDFSGRIYRFNESFFKYLFARHYYKEVAFKNSIMSKKTLHGILRELGIKNSNIIFAVVNYFNQKNMYEKEINMILTEKMHKLIELRHESIIGHGFESVSRVDIINAYSEPEKIVEELIYILKRVGIHFEENKYNIINDEIIRFLGEIK